MTGPEAPAPGARHPGTGPPRARRSERRGRDPQVVDLDAAALAPVVAALRDDATAQARQLVAAADAAGEATLAAARAEAARLLDQARSEGAAAAAQAAAGQLVEARRLAAGAVLAARRQAYDALRAAAVADLERRATAPEGRWIGERVAEAVRTRAGAAATVRPVGPAGARAAAGHRVAALGPAELVDRALTLLADEVGALWA